ncbi:MAG: DUF192 domain-containing protein [Candidatus Omnitrophica bacterium]|nr:DUF192 domain-containing protein [Candidatus Omnitrophota bacterium]
MQILNQTRNTILAQKAVLADTAGSRLVGLLKHDSLSDKEGMIITQCRSIHMFFMKFPIDVIFVDRKKVVVGLVRNIKPFRMSPYFWRASCAIELPSGSIDKTKTVLQDQIFWE